MSKSFIAQKYSPDVDLEQFMHGYMYSLSSPFN